MNSRPFAVLALAWLGAIIFILLRVLSPSDSLFGIAPGPEALSLRELGFVFPDPFAIAQEKAYAALTSEAAIVAALVAVLSGLYWLWVQLREDSDEDSLTIVKGRERQRLLRRELTLGALRERDPDFEEGAFLGRAALACERVARCLGDHDLAVARAFVSDGFHERLRRQIAAQSDAGVRHELHAFEVLEIELLGLATGRHYDSASVRARIRERRESVQEYEEVLTFLRLPGVKTLKGPGAIEGSCPSCGAPLTIVDAALCGYCRSWVNSGEFDWVLCEITAPWEWRYPDPTREVVGYEDLAEGDPSLSLEALEDRAALAFWRWQDARRRGDPAPLRAVAVDAFCETALTDGRFDREVLLGAVETAAFEAGEENDRVHVQVRWEGETIARAETGLERAGRGRRTDYLVFRRQVGVLSDPKAGLTTTRCPSCGHPPRGADDAACSACARPFNDGSRGWVLESVVPFGSWKKPEDRSSIAAMGTPSLDWGEAVPAAEAVAALARAVRADGLTQDREREYLLAYARRRGLPDQETRDILDGASRAQDAREEHPGVLRGLVRLCLLDGRIEDGERRLLHLVARGAGMHAFELNSLIREERRALVESAQRLLAGRPDAPLEAGARDGAGLY